MRYTGITVECSCERTVDVNDIECELRNEDWSPVIAECICGERYEVSLHMVILGKE